MQTAVTKRGQTVIPAPIRKRYHIDTGVQLVWLDDGEIIRVVPVSGDPIESLRGRARDKKMVEHLLAERKKDLDLDYRQ
ncbi:MAG: AbrB/MazE/SpoVT family DNA-binding domain-containing protein [Methanoregula sp.]|nr:AbrB/MazE/SpoVT family DNA-binding domain-containing protein [Methanoregula sp.]